MEARVKVDVLGCNVDVIGWEAALARLEVWASRHESRYICLCNAHVVVTANGDSRLEMAINGADMALPDGMPVAIVLRMSGHREQPRIAGPDFMWRYCAQAERTGQIVYFLGSTENTLRQLRDRLSREFPALKIAGAHSPPFRPLSNEEDAGVVEELNRSGAQVVFVGLGCPKQELWMSEHRGRVQAVMLGVGAAFDFHAGVTPRAPRWMQDSGLEWLHRLATEPRRLWRRYLVTNVKFLSGLAWRLLAHDGRAKKI